MLYPELINTSLIVTDGVLFDVKPVTWGDEPAAVQVNKVPVTFELRVMFVFRLVHCDLPGGEFDRSGVGYTVTV